MSHARTQIRQALVAALISASTNAGTNVYDTKETDDEANVANSISVSTPREQSDSEVIGTPVVLIERDVAVVIRCRVARSDGTHAAALDDLILQVEQCVAANTKIAGVLFTYPVETETDFDATSNTTRGEGYVSFKTRYRTSQAQPNILI